MPPLPPEAEQKKSIPPKAPTVNKYIGEPKQVVLDSNKAVQLPSAIDLEKAVLGALMIDSSSVELIIPILSSEMFFGFGHNYIFSAIKNISERNENVDILTVSEELKRLGVSERAGGDYYLIRLTQAVASSAHIEYHSRIITQKYVLREMISLGRKVVDDCLYRDPDIFDIMDDSNAFIEALKSKSVLGQESKKLNATEELRRKMELVAKGESPGVGIGISEFDDFSGGFQPRELTTIAARPGMGKTTVVLSAAKYIAINKNKKVSFFSLEMSTTDLKNRIAADLTSVDFKKIRNGKITNQEFDEVSKAFDFIDKSKLTIHDTSDTNNMFYTIVKQIVEDVENGCEIVFIDYVQLIKLSASGSNDRTNELNIITRELKALANRLNIPIVILAQLNRDVDKRPGKRPVLADLKQSGSIEEDSDCVIFIVRQYYYKERSNAGMPPPPMDVIGDTEFIVAKGRSTGTDDFRVYLDFLNYTAVSWSDKTN